MITDQETAARLSDFLENLGALSVTLTDAENQAIFEPLPGETIIWRSTKVAALFDEDVYSQTVKNLISREFGPSLLNSYSHELVHDQPWERAWQEHFQPTKFGERLWITPSGQERREPGTVCMTFDPGLAFGTGTHPTTALCLEWLAQQSLTGKNVIDYGCGSGILAVAALLLGAESAQCIDIDIQALEATQNNAEKNGVQSKIACHFPEQSNATDADIVIANILANPLVELRSTLSSLIKPEEGQLVLSGILVEQAPVIVSAYQEVGIEFSSPVYRDEWCRLDGRAFATD